MAGKDIHIPTVPTVWPLPVRATPITPRENLLLALNHQKPLWMPDIYSSSQVFQSAAAESADTPQGNLLSSITEWEQKIVWPKLSIFDWAADAAPLRRDPSRALFMPMYGGPFEWLCKLLGAQQALTELITEPTAVRAFFERLVDFKLDLFNRIRDHVPLDFIVAADDWGTARAPFFSAKTFEETLLEPTARFVLSVQRRGTKFVAHCCGKIDPLVPYLVEALGVDALEIQGMNDVAAILARYGSRVTVEYRPDQQLVHDPETTGAAVRAHVRDIVDRFGAQAVPGSGVVVSSNSSFAHIFYPMEDEFFRYSLARYAGITQALERKEINETRD